MFRPSALCLALPIVGLLMTANPASAQEAALDEALFAVYALDEMYHHRLPEASSTDPVHKPAHCRLIAFVAQRRRQFDTLRRYYERSKVDSVIVEVYRDYERELDVWKEFNHKARAAVQAYERAMSLAYMAAADRVMNTALAFGSQTYFAGGSGGDALAAWMLAASRPAALEKANLQPRELEAVKRFYKDFEELGKQYNPKISEISSKNFEKFKKLVAELRSEHDWKDAEFACDSSLTTQAKGAEPSRNPFALIDAAKKLLANDSATRDELLAGAEYGQRAANMVPAAKAYDFYRAGFLAAAGRLANQAAAKDLGADGFAGAIKHPPAAGPLALRLWRRYLGIKGDLNDDVIHHVIQASACAGRPDASYKLILSNCVEKRPHSRNLTLNASFSNNPAFWYDCARICSLMNDLGTSAECLQQAVQLGFRDGEAAKADPDLKKVRENPVTVKRFKALFP
jgi:hypothetical protein